MSDHPNERTVKTITIQDLFDATRTHKIGLTNVSKEDLLDHFQHFLSEKSYTLCKEEDIHKLHSCAKRIKDLWKQCSRSAVNVQSKYEDWLKEVIFCFPNSSPNPVHNSSQGSSHNDQCLSKKFDELSNKTKRRKIEPLVNNYSSNHLGFAYQTALWSEGNRSKFQAVKAISSASTEEISDVNNVLSKKSKKEPIPLSSLEALRFIIINNWTKEQYANTRKESKSRNADIWPPYNHVREEKKNIMPEKKDMIINEVSAKVSLQALADLTTTRRLEADKPNLKFNEEEKSVALNFIWKYGFDGSSNQSEYNQQFPNEFKDASDKNLFVTCAVPLLLKTSSMEHIIWQNPKPGSPKYCRPIEFSFVKETPDLVLAQHEKLFKDIGTLKPSKVNIENITFEVTHTFHLTMLDTKSCNAITGNSAACNCYLCGSRPSENNKLEVVMAKQSQKSLYYLGLATLHAWVKCFENLEHISYRLEVKVWKVIKPKHKEIVKKATDRIKKDFREKTGLIIDQPKQGGGNSNCGNTARRFFKNAAVSSQITGLDEELIKRFHVILSTLASGYAINVNAFRKYAEKTANLYVEKYYWYPMSATTHKILIHGADIVSSFGLPIGQFTEEALEAANKSYRKFRRSFSRKSSRVETTADVLCRMMVMSDLMILNSEPKRKTPKLSNDVLGLLEPNSDFDSLTSSTTESDDDDDDNNEDDDDSEDDDDDNDDDSDDDDDAVDDD